MPLSAHRASSVAHPGRLRRARAICLVSAMLCIASAWGSGEAQAVPVLYGLSTFAGTGVSNPPVAGLASMSPLNGPRSVALDPGGNVYIADTDSNQVVKVDTSGVLSVVAGDGSAGAPVAGLATSSPLDSPGGVAVDAAGNLYIADTSNNLIEKVTDPGPSGVLSVIAGTGLPGGAPIPGLATSSPLDTPIGLAIDASGNLYIADTANNRIEKVTNPGPSGVLSVVAGTGAALAPIPGLATSSPLNSPGGVAVDAAGNLYIADTSNNRIEKVTNPGPSGVLSVIAGTGTTQAPIPGLATASPLDTPIGVAVDATGNLYIADTSNHRIEKVTNPGASGVLSVIAGTGTAHPPIPGTATASPLDTPIGVAADSAGAIYVADYLNSRVERLTVVATGPTVTSVSPVSATVGKSYTHSFTASGSPSPTWTVASGTLPAGLTLDSPTGVLAGTPTSAGSSTFTVRATNPADQADQAATVVTVEPAGPRQCGPSIQRTGSAPKHAWIYRRWFFSRHPRFC